MKIRLLILDNDNNYLQRIVKIFNNQYSDKLEIYSFSEMALAKQQMSESRVDVFLASNFFDVSDKDIPSRCGFAYLVESLEIETWKGKRTICKFQKGDLIYKEILGIYSEVSADIIGYRAGEEGENAVISFISTNGGTGSSTVAAACAYKKAICGKRVLYLNFEQSGISSQYFSGEGQLTIGDVIYAIKSKKSNLALKLESTVKRDECGVYFYDSCPVALDMLDLNAEELKDMLKEIRMTGNYDYIILDLDFNYQPTTLSLLGGSNSIICVLDGTEASFVKFKRTVETLTIMEKNGEINFLPKISLLYNKFSNKDGHSIDSEDFKVIGGAPKFIGGTTRQIMEQLANLQIFNTL